MNLYKRRKGNTSSSIGTPATLAYPWLNSTDIERRRLHSRERRKGIKSGVASVREQLREPGGSNKPPRRSIVAILSTQSQPSFLKIPLFKRIFARSRRTRGSVPTSRWKGTEIPQCSIKIKRGYLRLALPGEKEMKKERGTCV